MSDTLAQVGGFLIFWVVVSAAAFAIAFCKANFGRNSK